MKIGDSINVRGFSKLGKIDDDAALDYYIVEFQRVLVRVDKIDQIIILSKNCVKIED